MPNPVNLSFKQTIVRIYAAPDVVVGTGMLTTDNRLLTCAHVVQVPWAYWTVKEI